MPPMTLLGWLHTVMGVVAILMAAYTLYHHRQARPVISPDNTFGGRFGARHL